MAGEEANTKMSLAKLQAEIIVPKDKKNEYGGFKYRSAEDILSAVKNIINQYGWTILCTDDVVNVGNHNYIRATVQLFNEKNAMMSSTSAMAREEVVKKGMDAAQISGSASSYARKYALCGLLAISDGQDPDAMDNREQHKLSGSVNIASSKEIMDDIRFERAIAMIKEGKVTKEDIISKYALNAEQLKKLQ